MTITVNGATNTITAPSGLAIAGNTAVTGTLSATGLLSSAAGVQFRGADATTYELMRVVGAGANNPGLFVKATEATKLVELFQSGSAGGETLRVAGMADFTSTGLAVTGTLSAIGANGVDTAHFTGAGTGTGAGYVFLTNAGTGFAKFGVEGAVASIITGAINYSTSISGANGVNISGDNGANIQTRITPTALTLGSGVNLNVADGKAVAWGASTAYITGSSAASTLGAYIGSTKIWEIDGTGATTFDFPVKISAKYLEGSEMTAPAAPAANGFRIFAEDNGAGKTRLMVQFATGAAQQIAIEP